MLGVHLLDSNGTTISSLTQWDYNITLVIEESGFTTAPMFHFAHEDSENTLPIQSILDDGKISVEVPNILLQEAKKILVYIFVKSGESGRTVEIMRIPVRDKAKPLDYEYSDNLEIVNLYELQEELKAATAEAQSASDSATEAANNANNKASAAQTAADAANTATSNANKATQDAIEAKDDAVAATTSATQAANSANSAASEAEDATQAANQATSQLNTVIQNANTAISNANQATSNAQTATTAANTATSQANTARDQANTAAGAATTATSQANTARDQANAAAQAANQATEEINEILDDINNVMAVTLIDDNNPATNKTYSSQYIETNFRWTAATDEEILAILEET